MAKGIRYTAGAFRLEHTCKHVETHELTGRHESLAEQIEILESLPCTECTILAAELQAEAAELQAEAAEQAAAPVVEEVATVATTTPVEMELAEDRVVLARRDARTAYNRFDRINKPELLGNVRYEEARQEWLQAEQAAEAATEERNRLAEHLSESYSSDPERRRERSRWDAEFRTEAYEEMELISAGR